MNLSSINNRLNELRIIIKNLQKSIKAEKLALSKVSFEQYDEISLSNLDSDFNIEPFNFKQLKPDLSYIRPITEQIPTSNGCRLIKKHRIKIGAISDNEFISSMSEFCELVPVTYINYQSVNVDLLIVHLSYKNELLLSRTQRRQTIEIMRFFKKQNIPVIYYSTNEDANLERQIEISKNSDHIICSSDLLKSNLESYIEREIHVIPAAINPLLFNPIGMHRIPKNNKALFVANKLKNFERNKALRMLIDGLYNNNFYLEAFEDHDLESLDINLLYKLYNWFLNITDGTEKLTSLGTRLFEAQASGNLVVSNYSITLNNQFPNVFLTYNDEELSDILYRYTDEELYRFQVIGIRNMMSKFTTYNLFCRFLELCHLPIEDSIFKIAVVIKNPSRYMIDQFNNQSYPHKELILEENFDDSTLSRFDMVAFFDKDYFYEEFYLEDMINAFKYTSSDYITKDAYYENHSYVKGVEHDYIDKIASKYRSIFWTESFTADRLLNLEDNSYLPNGYSVDPFEIRRVAEIGQSPCIIADSNEVPVLSVIVPTFNNGDLLLNKCIRSLRRSSIFNKMEIIIVDDGSTDQYTPMIIRRLARIYPNIVTFFFEEGGSGTASRPRNKGFQLSKAPYITYLDPDNEAVNDGYAKLYYEISNNDYDIVIGNMMRLGEREIHLNYYKTFLKFNSGKDHASGNLFEYLVNTKFKPMSIQALVVKREIIEENKLLMPIGAAGQDSMFFHELIINSNKIKVINQDIHVYYSAVNGSVVNSVSKNFYIKYLTMEQYRVQALTKYNLIDEYIEKRFEYYFTNWYLKKLRLVKQVDFIESLHLIYQIYQMYKDRLKISNQFIKQFIKLYESKRFDDIYDHLP